MAKVKTMGKVRSFNQSKGYGFIIGDDGESYFIHYSNIIGDGFKTLDKDQEVEFEIQQGPKGAQAIEVEVI